MLFRSGELGKEILYLSPYIFLLVYKGLSSLLKRDMSSQEISGLKIAQHSPTLSHLFFADNTLIFYRANKEEADKVMKLLKMYGKASGQVINAEKSPVFFSMNTGDEVNV